MAVEGDLIYKDRDTIVAELVAALQARIPDIVLDVDSVARILIETWATAFEGIYLANQLLHDDIFPQTASALALQRMGEFWGNQRLGGVAATGTLRFSGVGGTVVPIGTLAAAPGTSDDTLRFSTTAVATIPSPGIPSAPVASDGGAGALPAGTYEYAVTFTTALGETAIGASSTPLVIVANHQIALTNIALGGTGTVSRKLYRRFNGGAWGLVTTIANNTATTYTDNTTTTTTTPPSASTAEQVDVSAVAEDVGIDYNVGIGSVTTIADAVPGVQAVTNPVAFTGGADLEDIEVFRSRLLAFIQSPKSGTKADLEAWAEAVTGVETATAFSNDNLGTAAPGHATVRITGPGGTVPSSTVQANVLAALQAQDLANITLHVGTFTPHNVDVSLSVTPAAGYATVDITPSVQAAVAAYISSVPVGGTVTRAGIIAAVFNTVGVANVIVTLPSADVTTASTEKATTGTVTVS